MRARGRSETAVNFATVSNPLTAKTAKLLIFPPPPPTKKSGKNKKGKKVEFDDYEDEQEEDGPANSSQSVVLSLSVPSKRPANFQPEDDRPSSAKRVRVEAPNDGDPSAPMDVDEGETTFLIGAQTPKLPFLHQVLSLLVNPPPPSLRPFHPFRRCLN